MADRYQDRPFPADDDYGHGDDQRAPARTESDPLAELARLIGQTDPFANIGRANQQVPPRNASRDQYQPPAALDEDPPAGPPPWMQRATRQEAPAESYRNQAHPSDSYESEPYPAEPQSDQDYHPEQDYPSSEHPLRRYAAQYAAPEPEPEYDAAPQSAEVDQLLDPARYDDALYGELDAHGHQAAHDPAYADDAYAYQDGYDEGEAPVQKRRGGLATVVVVLALAVVGTGAAFAYRTYIGSPRSGDPPIIKADTSPTKIVPAPSDGSGKVPDRLAAGDGTEKIVPREEAPVDVNANTKSGPRMVFPALNQNANPPSPSSVAPNGPPPANAANGTMPNNQPRAIKTFTVRGDQPDASGTPVASVPAQPSAAKPAAAARTTAALPRTPPSAANANASSGNAPLSLSPQAAPSAPAPAAPTRLATNAPVPIAPSTSSGAGGYLVQVSSQKNEADAQASYRVLQGKFPSVLGSRSPMIKRADLGDKGIYYRAMVGPFGSPDEASQFCGSLKSAGGQCVVQRN
jgi:hypothetical protein